MWNHDDLRQVKVFQAPNEIRQLPYELREMGGDSFCSDTDCVSPFRSAIRVTLFV